MDNLSVCEWISKFMDRNQWFMGEFSNNWVEVA